MSQNDNKSDNKNRNQNQNPGRPQTQAEGPPGFDPEEYLRSKGWKHNGKNIYGASVWTDPRGSHEPPVKQNEVKLPTKDGGTQTIKQMTGKPIPWDYDTYQAVEIQRQRDAIEKK